jgi:hypothetical protein
MRRSLARFIALAMVLAIGPALPLWARAAGSTFESQLSGSDEKGVALSLSLSRPSDKGVSMNRDHLVIHQIDASDFPQIVLYVSVLDSVGQPVFGLKAKEFKVVENGRDQSPIQLQNELPPLSTALVIDSSGSMKRVMQKVQSAAIAYIDNVRPEDEVLLIQCADTAKVMQTFTMDKHALQNAVRALSARGNTALYDAIFGSIKSFGGKKGRKLILVLTDGKDDDGKGLPLSRKTVEDVLAAAREVNVPIFAIGLGTLEQEGQYGISYTTSLNKSDASWHQVEVIAQGSAAEKRYGAPLEDSEGRSH